MAAVCQGDLRTDHKKSGMLKTMGMNNSDGQVRAVVDRLGRPSLEVLDREIARQERRDAYAKLALRALLALILTASVVVLLTNLWLSVLQIDGTSMTPQLQLGDVVLAVKTDSPAQKDVISFYYNNKTYVKRVIGKSGDWIDISGEGIVSVNGRVLSEPYVAELGVGDCGIELPYQVPSGTVFVMGDNRPISKDSRGPLGPIDKEQIIGKVVFRLWPLSRAGRVR